MTYIAKQEINFMGRHYLVGETVPDKDVNMMMRQLCMVRYQKDSVLYKVILKANGGIGADILTETDGYFQFPECTFTAPANKEFKGWSMTAEGSGTKKTGDKINVVMDSEYYAQWIPIVATIKFGANGGAGKMLDVKRDKGETYTLPTCTFTAPVGKTFKGWSLNKKDIVTSITAEDVTVYAVWQDVKAEPAKEPTK